MSENLPQHNDGSQKILPDEDTHMTRRQAISTLLWGGAAIYSLDSLARLFDNREAYVHREMPYFERKFTEQYPAPIATQIYIY